MKADEDKNLEKLIDKMLENQKLEKPSFDFTSKIMQQIELSEKSQPIVYKPLLSKNTMVVICILIASIFVISTLSPTNTSTSKWMIYVNYSSIFKINTSFSKTAMYCISIGTLMLLTQIIYLKNHFNNKT